MRSASSHSLLSLALSPFPVISVLHAQQTWVTLLRFLPPSWLLITLHPAYCPWDITSATVLVINPVTSFFFSTLRGWKLLEEFAYSCGLKFLPTHGLNIIWASDATPQCFCHSLIRSIPCSSYSKPLPISPYHYLNRPLIRIIGAGFFAHRIKIIPLLLDLPWFWPHYHPFLSKRDPQGNFRPGPTCIHQMW